MSYPFGSFSTVEYETFALAGRLSCRVVAAALEGQHRIAEVQDSLLTFSGVKETW